jgi:hypothetical protein
MREVILFASAYRRLEPAAVLQIDLGRLLRQLFSSGGQGLVGAGPGRPVLPAIRREDGEIAAPSVYIHFSDRNELLLALLEKLIADQVAMRAAAECDAAKAGGGARARLLARSLAGVRFGLEHLGRYKVLFEGRVVPRLNATAQQRVATIALWSAFD